MNIINAIRDPALLRPYFGNGDDALSTWVNWLACLKATFGIRPFTPRDRKIIRKCTGRDPDRLPEEGFSTALWLVGRRSGKSRIAACCGAYLAALAGLESNLAKGEKGLVACCAPTKGQSDVERAYMRACFEPELLAAEVIRETAEGFDLRNGVSIQLLQGDFKTVRNYTLCGAVISEGAFFGIEEGAKVKSDTELIRAIQPGLATTGGKMIVISSPYAKRGWCYRTWKAHYANDKGRVLVWNTDSRTMNPQLPQSVVDEAMAEDLQAALSEYGGQFRDDVVLFIPREAIERLVKPGRRELMPRPDSIKYTAFVDVSGARHEDSALAIAHQGSAEQKGLVILDRVVRWAPDFGSPQSVVSAIAQECRRFGLRGVYGDNYGAEWVASAFRSAGLGYAKSPQPKSELYREMLPMIFSDQIELLDDALLIDQLAGLERRTRSGGKDIIDHPQGGKDDVANAVAGACVVCSKKRFVIGAI